MLPFPELYVPALQFPVYFWLGSVPLHPHVVMEAIAFTVSFTISRRLKRADTIDPAQRLIVLTAALVGALLGAKGLVILQHWDLFQTADFSGALASWDTETWLLLLRGKTIVGAMLGGFLAVEGVKKLVGIRCSTGDRFVYPLLFGTAIGRIGCFLTGLDDQTYGIATALPWGIDFGDGVLRHPTQLYEIGFLLMLFVGLRLREQRGLANGKLFQFYFAGYLGFRFVIDFIKPDFRPGLGVTAIQVACAIALLLYVPLVMLQKDGTAPG